jgi:flagellar brake protein
MTNSSTATTRNRQSRTEAITDPVRIVGLLNRVKDSHSLVTVRLPDSTRGYNSAVLEVDSANSQLQLDELKPSSGHNELLKAGRLQVNTRIKGIEITFDGIIVADGISDGIAYYRIKLPTSLEYSQQRAHYRATVGYATRVPVQLTRDNGESLSGNLNDISVGGIGIRFSTGLAKSLDPGELIPNCQLRLPTDIELTCEIEIRFQSVSVRGNSRMVGARFIQLSPAQENAIAQYVAALDRELVKKSAQNKR